MITLLIASIIAFITSVLKIKKLSGGKWINFNPPIAGFGLYLTFLLSIAILLMYILTVIIFLIKSGIIP